MTKESRGAVISIRLSEDEQTHLRAIAANQGTSVSDIVRGFVASSISPALPVGESRPAAATLGNSTEGVFWANGIGTAVGSNLTISFDGPYPEPNC